MFQYPAAILTACHVACQLVLGHRDDHIGRVPHGRLRGGDLDLHAELIGFAHSSRDRDVRLPLACRLADCATDCVEVAADLLQPSVDDELWSVDTPCVKDPSLVFRLTVAETGRGERITPSQAVPVVNVLTEG